MWTIDFMQMSFKRVKKLISISNLWTIFMKNLHWILSKVFSTSVETVDFFLIFSLLIW
jgi:hypothetical protein